MGSSEKTTVGLELKPLVFNSADWDLVRTQPFWHSFHYDWEVGRQIKQKMSKRGIVWEIGLWPDAETEKVARQCAEIFEEQFGLPNSSLIPDDSVMVLQTRGDGLECDLEDTSRNCLGLAAAGAPYGLGASRLGYPRLSARRISPRA